jgi:hypothetical protein
MLIFQVQIFNNPLLLDTGNKKEISFGHIQLFLCITYLQALRLAHIPSLLEFAPTYSECMDMSQ